MAKFYARNQKLFSTMHLPIGEAPKITTIPKPIGLTSKKYGRNRDRRK